MADSDMKTVLHRYLDAAREAILWKLDGLDEYEIRRPLTPTGTNLLGLVKHLAGCELDYFGDVFGRTPDIVRPRADDDDNADMWAAPGESREFITGLYRQACEHADATIGALPLGAAGKVPWWTPGRQEVTLHQILVHMIAESHRHAGHADIVRELIDGTVGLRRGNENLPAQDESSWEAYRSQLEKVAREAH
ncbi:DinB family protein [Arthrobacter dokdonensis]|uniref:DinB family protein n=1 Tax=Arthrobacter dokdonellae TaxID=2211210 RepID=UPI000DE580B5|nr:DinB family protein [Arthrobacter dokdonellae]